MRGLRMQKVWLEFLHLHEPHPATSRAMGKKDGKAATTAPQVKQQWQLEVSACFGGAQKTINFIYRIFNDFSSRVLRNTK